MNTLMGVRSLKQNNEFDPLLFPMPVLWLSHTEICRGFFINKTMNNDISYQKFGKLTAICLVKNPTKGSHRYWKCKCDCGNEKTIRANHLINGKILGCGCDRYQKVSEKNKKHGHASGGKLTGIYISWAKMISRCVDPYNNRWHRYGGRGIKVCDRWRAFENFLIDMGSSWEKGLSIDRIDNEGNYEPLNCKWSTAKEQANNRSTFKKI